MTTSLPRLLLLTDRSQLLPGRALVPTVTECVQAGVSHVVLRELDEPDERRTALAQSLAATGATVIAAHRPLPGAVGLHLPSAGQPGRATSSERGASDRAEPAGGTTCDGPLGRSCHTGGEVVAAVAEGVDYVTLGPYAATASKPGYQRSLGEHEWETVCASSAVPVFALGGITPDNATAALADGAHGVAVMGAVMRARDPAAVVRALLAALGGPHP